MVLQGIWHGKRFTTIFTFIGKLSMIVDYMVLQGIWHGKRFTTIFTFIAFMVILFHVMLIHSKCVVNNITNVTLHVGAILDIHQLETILILHLGRHRLGAEVRL